MKQAVPIFWATVAAQSYAILCVYLDNLEVDIFLHNFDKMDFQFVFSFACKVTNIAGSSISRAAMDLMQFSVYTKII